MISVSPMKSIFCDSGPSRVVSVMGSAGAPPSYRYINWLQEKQVNINFDRNYVTFHTSLGHHLYGLDRGTSCFGEEIQLRIMIE
jgi:hypothetical protein